jgi:hypothetical protein
MSTFPAIEEFSCLFWYLNIYYRILVLKLKHINQVYILTHFFNIQFNSIRPSTCSCPKWLKKFWLLDGNTCIFHMPREGYKLRPNSLQFDHTNSIWWGVRLCWSSLPICLSPLLPLCKRCNIEEMSGVWTDSWHFYNGNLKDSLKWDFERGTWTCCI